MTFPSSMFGTLVSLGAQIVGARREQKRRSNASIARNDYWQRMGREVARLNRANIGWQAKYALLVVENAKLRTELDRRDGFTKPRTVA